MNRSVMFSSKFDGWRTPKPLFAELHREFRFLVDLAATKRNALVRRFYTSRDSALTKDWSKTKRNYCNPPYSRGLQSRFIEKAAMERKRGALTVMLLPARTETRAFHRYIWNKKTHRPRRGVQVRFIEKRLRFQGAKDNAPFPSMIVIFRP